MKHQLVAEIENAFRNVQRGKIGIRQASAIDSRYNPGDLHDNPELYERAREEDAAETSWTEIPDEVLANDPAVFSYLDDAGLKFILPAMMRWSLSDRFQDQWNVIGSLLLKLIAYDEEGISPSEWVSRLQLSNDQVRAVVEWLEYSIPDEEIPNLNPYEAENLKHWKSLIS